MSQFDQLGKVGQFGPGVPPMLDISSLAGASQPAREMNLTERVMTHDQRIQALEMQHKQIVADMTRLVAELQRQLGLRIE